jgi:hypothetical protein
MITAITRGWSIMFSPNAAGNCRQPRLDAPTAYGLSSRSSAQRYIYVYPQAQKTLGHASQRRILVLLRENSARIYTNTGLVTFG